MNGKFEKCYASRELKKEHNERCWVDIAVLNGEKSFDNHVSMVTIWDVITFYAIVCIAAVAVVFTIFYYFFKLLGAIRTKRDEKRNKNIDLEED